MRELLFQLLLLFAGYSSSRALQLQRNSFRRRPITSPTPLLLPRLQRVFSSTLSQYWFAGTPTTGNSDNKFNTTANAYAQAAEFRRRAQQLKDEAASLELSLEIAKTQASKKKAAEIASWMDKLFLNDRPLTASAVARILKEDRFSERQVLTLLEALYRQGKNAVYTQTNEVVLFPPNETANITISTLTYLQLLLDAAKLLDESDNPGNRRWSGRVHTAMQSQLKEWNRQEEADFRRKVAYLASQKKQEPTNQTANALNTTTEVPKPLIPLWVPPGLVAEVNATRNTSLDPSDILLIQNSVLTRSRFFCTSVESVSNAALFRGNVRGRTDPNTIDPSLSKAVFGDMQREMEREQGLSDRVRLLFLIDPQWRTRDVKSPQPIVLAIPKLPVLSQSRSRVLYAAAAVASLSATLLFAIKCYALNPQFYASIVLDHDLSAVTSCWPVVCGLVAVHAVHETAHQLVAKRRGLKLRWPLPLPSLRFGSYGCITSLRSFPKNRDAIFDFSLVGPASSMLLSLLFLFVGCARTVRASEATLLAYPFVTIGTLRSSLLMGSILACSVPKFAVLPLSQPVPVHPLVVVGWSGMIASALNLLPISRLDGGRACNAAMGSRFAAVATAWTLLMMFSFGPVAGSWALFMVFLHRKPEVNALDEVTPVNKRRLGAWVASVCFAAAALCPFPGTQGVF